MLSRGTNLLKVAVFSCAVALGAGCEFEDGHPPVPRISLSPDGVVENDGFQTSITLDATGSSDPVDDPNNTRPLRFEWRILNDEFRFDAGDVSSAMPMISVRGDRPATIELTATDEEGFSATTSVQLRLIVFQ